MKYIAIILISVICMSGHNAVMLSKWKFEIPITVSASLVDGSTDFTDMPYYVALSGLPAHFWNNVKAGGADIRLYTAAYPGGTELPRHVISFTDAGSSGTGTLFTKRTIDDAATTLIYLRYGNPSADAPAAGDANGQYAVYTTLKQGWSLQEGSGAGSGGILQLAANADHGTPGGTVADITGKLEKGAIDFAGGGSDRIDVGTAVHWDNSSTFMCWVRVDELPSTNGLARIINRQSGTTSGTYRFDLHNTTNADALGMTVHNGTNFNSTVTTANTFAAGDVGNWRHIAYGIATTTGTHYKTGSLVTASDGTIHNVTSTPSVSAYLAQSLDGGMDMPMWFNTTLVANHVLAVYRNQNEPASYHTIGNVKFIGLRQVIN